MGEVARATIEEILRADNPSAREAALRIYADALRTYAEAADNVRRHGAVCAHPKTGAPIANPYLSIRTAHGAILRKMGAIDAARAFARAMDDAAVASATR